MHNGSFLSAIKGNMSVALNAQITARALYFASTARSNIGLNTVERKAPIRRAEDCIICGESLCGSNEFPESGRCVE